MPQPKTLQVPPESTGPKLRYRLVTDLIVTSETDRPNEGQIVRGQTSGARGIFLSRDATSTIVYYVHILDDNGPMFAENEVLINDAATETYATISEVYSNIYTPNVHVADPDTPEYIQRVDKNGAAFATFPEGTPQFDAYGRMQMSQMQAVGEYYHTGKDLAAKYWTEEENGATVTHDVQQSVMVYSNPTTAGARSCRTTGLYHVFKPFTSQLIYTVVTLGDAGKTGVVRSWGYFDTLNGMGFRMDEGTLKVFMRTDISGTVQDFEVAQEDWNVQTLTDPVASEYVLDVTKPNTYWMDIQTNGNLRFGVITPRGVRITVHKMETGNTNFTNYMRTSTLPMRWEQENINATGSTSEMRVRTGVVFTESADVLYQGELLHVSPIDPIQLNYDDGKYKPFLSFKAKSLVNGMPNNIIGIHETFDWSSSDDSNLHIGIFVFPSETYLQNHFWSETIVPGTMLYVDEEGTDIPQYQQWNQTGDFVGSITGTTLTVETMNSGLLEKNHTLIGAGIPDNCKVVRRISAEGGVGTYELTKSATVSSISIASYPPIRPIESFIVGENTHERTALGDRMEKAFGLGPNLNVAEEDKAVFVFAVKVLKDTGGPIDFFYTKFWKEIR